MKYKDFELLGEDACGIYRITNLINGHFYIGQTSRKFKIRWKEHIYSATYNSGNQKHTPLHQAIIKYGVDNFNFEILEKCNKEELDMKEQYWINTLQSNSYDNYNQTAGGQNGNLQYKTPDFVFDVIKLLQETNLNQAEIASICKCSDNVVTDINCGIHYRLPNLTYPIRKTTIDDKIIEIAKELSNKSLTFKELADKYQVSLSTVKRINKGEGRYHLDNYSYPIYEFKNKCEDIIDNIINDLINTSMPQTEIAKKYNVSYGTVYKTNKGERNHRDDLNYPLRKR